MYKYLMLMLLAAPAHGAEGGTGLPSVLLQSDDVATLRPLGASCPGALQLDDGSFENGAGWNEDAINDANLYGYVQAFDVPGGRARLEQVCVCWTREDRVDEQEFVDVDLVAYADDGPGGGPGTFLGFLDFQTVEPVPLFPGTVFAAFDGGGIEYVGERIYVGVSWLPQLDQGFFVCGDQSPGLPASIYRIRLFAGGADAVEATSFTALGIRPVLEGTEPPPPPEDPAPPAVEPLTTTELPGFDFWIRINGDRLATIADSLCASETLCAAGALPTRSEVELRIVGPKPNGFLWPTIVKFTTSQVEAWIRQRSTGVTRYYLLEGATPGNDVLPGLFDRGGFQP